MSSMGSGYLLHRNRDHHVPDPDAPPLKQIKFYLDRYKIKEALQIFFYDGTLKLLRDEPDFMWDIIPVICRRLRGLCQYRFRVFEGCERMLCRIAVDEHCNPKEVLISLLSEISQPSTQLVNDSQTTDVAQQTLSHEEDDNVFRAMIRPLEGTLLRMNDPTPRGENYRWVLKVLMNHIDNINIPQDNNLDANKRLSLPYESTAKRFIEVLPLVLSFIEDFSDFKPFCGSDYDVKLPFPILTKSQIDEVLNGELAADENIDNEDYDQDNDRLTNSAGMNLKPDPEDIEFATFSPKSKTLSDLSMNYSNHDDNQDKKSRSNGNNNVQPDETVDDGDDDDLGNFYNEDSTSARGDIIDASVTALISVVERPLTFLDLTSHCSDLKICANRCLNILLEQVPNLFAPIYKRVLNMTMFNDQLYPSLIGEQNDDDNKSLQFLRYNRATYTTTQHQTAKSTLSLATCSYIFRCERTQTSPSVVDQSFPQILTHETLLFCHIPYINALLDRSEVLGHEKGLLLLESLLAHIEPHSLDEKYLDLIERSSLLRNIFQIMIYSPMCSSRRRAYNLFTCICDQSTYECKIKIFERVLTQTELRPSVRAACIDQYRKHLTIIHKELTNSNQQLAIMTSDLSDEDMNKIPELAADTINLSSSIFKDHERKVLVRTILDQRRKRIVDDLKKRIPLWQARYNVLGGESLVHFLKQCIQASLPDSHHTDLIDNYELILATLTMFRYLKLRKLVVKNEIEEKYLNVKGLKKTFFDPIRKAIALIMTELKQHHGQIVASQKVVSPPKIAQQVQAAQSKTSKKKQSNNDNTISSTTTMATTTAPNDVGLAVEPRFDGIRLTDPMAQFEAQLGRLRTKQDEVDCINWVMCRLDLVESILVRTCDLYNC